MCGTDRVRNRLRRLTYGLAGVALVLVVYTTMAANNIRVTPQHAGYVRAGTNALGGTVWQTRAEFVAEWQSKLNNPAGTAQNTSRWYTRTGPISAGTLGSMGKKALRGGVYGAAVSLAVEGVIDGAGWAIGELQDQVLDGTPQDPQVQPTGTRMWCGVNAAQGCTSQPSSPTALALCSADAATYNCTQLLSSGPSFAQYRAVRKTDGLVSTWNLAGRLVNAPTPEYGTGYEPGIVSDVDFGEKLKEHPELVNDLLTDPRTGRPIMTPELQAMIDDIKEEIRQEEGFDPQDPTPTPDLNDDTQADEGSPWPSFCSWASVVCEWINWTKETDEDSQPVEVPWEDAPIVESNWSAGLGGGSCPSAHTFNVSLAGHSASLAFEYQPICSFATTMRPVVYAMSLVVAAFIVAGLRNNKGA